MIPEKICFTNYEIDPSDIFFPKKYEGWVIPHQWTKVVIRQDVDFSGYESQKSRKIDEWMVSNTTGKWHCATFFDGDLAYVFAFENETDAVLFRLTDPADVFGKTF